MAVGRVVIDDTRSPKINAAATNLLTHLVPRIPAYTEDKEYELDIYIIGARWGH